MRRGFAGQANGFDGHDAAFKFHDMRRDLRLRAGGGSGPEFGIVGRGFGGWRGVRWFGFDGVGWGEGLVALLCPAVGHVWNWAGRWGGLAGVLRRLIGDREIIPTAAGPIELERVVIGGGVEVVCGIYGVDRPVTRVDLGLGLPLSMGEDCESGE